jgi:hypothetical protein
VTEEVAMKRTTARVLRGLAVGLNGYARKIDPPQTVTVTVRIDGRALRREIDEAARVVDGLARAR